MTAAGVVVPEGDTVYRAARLLDRALSGHDLLLADLRVPSLATSDLSGARVLETVSRGKHLLTRLRLPEDRPDPERELTLHTHLKMEGAWRVYDDGARWRRPAHQARVVLGVTGRQAVGFSLGIVELLPTAEESTTVGHLGPDLLGSDWDEAEALTRLRAEPDRAVHEALLDQRNLAGVGNMYAAELCFISGLHPLTPVREVRDLPRLVRRSRQMLLINKERPVQATTGDLRQPHWVYARAGQPCRRCGTRIATGEAGAEGRRRVTFWCPHCQPAPAD